MDICQIGCDICEFDSLRGLGIDIIGRIHFDNRDRFAIWMGSIGKAAEPWQQTSGCWHLTLQFLEPWHGRLYECEIFIASCTDNIYELKQGKSEGFDSCDRPSNLKLDSNRQFFCPCDREIWWMTLQNNRAPLLCYFKLCASFRSHWWIQTSITVRKRPIWVKFDDF